MAHLPIGSMYGIYANMWGILMVNVTIYSSTMDPMGMDPGTVPSERKRDWIIDPLVNFHIDPGSRLGLGRRVKP